MAVTDDRLSALEGAVKTIAKTLYGPNGGGLDHVAEAQALYSRLWPDEQPQAEPEAEIEPPTDAGADTGTAPAGADTNTGAA